MPQLIDIVYEDSHLLVVNKASNLVSEPGIGNQEGTLVDLLYQHHEHLQALPRGGLLHRLDKDTTGLLLVAKSDAAMRALHAQFQAKTIRRLYTVLIHGRVQKNAGKVSIGLKKCWRRKRIVINPQGQPAITYYQAIRSFQHYTLLHCLLETGRTHQIRAHLHYLKYYVVGDPLYSEHLKTITMPRQALHATHLSFHHPVTHQRMSIVCSLPPDFQHLIDILDADHATIIR